VKTVLECRSLHIDVVVEESHCHCGVKEMIGVDMLPLFVGRFMVFYFSSLRRSFGLV
jgi:hypothetical protein